MPQQILILSTDRRSLRAAVFGWDAEDSNLFVADKPIGMTPAPRFNCAYATPLAALADNWQLLSPPVAVSDGYEWWLTRDVSTMSRSGMSR
jgi:hypothetical protein